jgi:hypothetical protein
MHRNLVVVSISSRAKRPAGHQTVGVSGASHAIAVSYPSETTHLNLEAAASRVAA